MALVAHPAEAIVRPSFEDMADDMLAIIAMLLAPDSTCEARMAGDTTTYAESSVGACHYCSLSKRLMHSASERGWVQCLSSHRRSHYEALACFRVLESAREHADWPLEVLKLRASRRDATGRERRLSHCEFTRHVLRTAYRQIALEVHPDRLASNQADLAHKAMSVLNEAYLMGILHFARRDVQEEVLVVDALGAEHITA